jgi:ribonuclease HI
MGKQPQELKNFKHRELMNEFNDLMIRIKRHLFNIPGNSIKPTNEELDDVTNKIINILQQDNKPFIKYVFTNNLK